MKFQLSDRSCSLTGGWVHRVECSHCFLECMCYSMAFSIFLWQKSDDDEAVVVVWVGESGVKKGIPLQTHSHTQRRWRRRRPGDVKVKVVVIIKMLLCARARIFLSLTQRLQRLWKRLQKDWRWKTLTVVVVNIRTPNE
jgi:hypothetical protein